MKIKRLSYVLSVVAVALLLVAGFAVSALAGAPTVGTGNDIVSLDAVYLPEDGSLGYVLIHKVAAEHVRADAGARIYGVPSGWYIFSSNLSDEITSTYENAEAGYRYFKQTVKMTADQVISGGEYAYYPTVTASRKWTGKLNLSIDPEMFPAAPTGISYKDGVWTGLDPAKSYRYAPAGLNATGTELIAAGDFSPLDPNVPLDGGLWAVSIASDGKTYFNSEPVIIFAGNGSNASNLWVESSAGTLAVADASAIGKATFVQGKWTGYTLKSKRYTGFGGYNFSITSTAIPWTKTGMNVPSKLPEIKAYNYAYSYNADQVIPFEKFESFTFEAGTRRCGFKLTGGKIYTVLTLYVASLDGSVKTVSAKQDVTASYKNQYGGRAYVTFERGDFEAVDGYVVGMVIYPYGDFSDDATFSTWPYNGMEPVVWFENAEYEIVLPIAEKPVLTVDEDGKVTGLESGVAYEYAPVNVEGIGKYAAIADNATFTAPAGLIAIRVAGSKTNRPSAPVLLYVKGNSTHKLWIEEEENKLADANSAGIGEITFAEGKWSGSFLHSNRYWSDAVYHGYVLSITASAVPMIKETNPTPEQVEEQVKGMETYNYAYAYTPDQIIPLSEFRKLTFKAAHRRIEYAVSDAKVYAKVVFYVATEDGSIEQREAKVETVMTLLPNAIPVEVSLSDLAKTDGYLVGLVIYPYGDIESVTYGARERYPSTPEPVVEFIRDGYRINLPEEVISGITISEDFKLENLDPAKTYELSKVNGLSSAGSDIVYADKVVADENTVVAAGLWALKVLGTEGVTYDSTPVLIYVAGDYEARRDLGVLNAAGTRVTAGESESFTTGTWSGDFGDNNYNAGKYVLGCSGGVITRPQAEAIRAAAEAGDAVALLAAQTDAMNAGNKYNVKYAFTPDEFIPVSEVLKYSYAMKNNVIGINYEVSATARVTFYVVDEYGALTQYVHESKVDWMVESRRYIDFKSAEGWKTPLPETGYLVAIKIQPYVMTDPTKISFRAAYNTQYWTNVDPVEYVIKAPSVAPTLSAFPVPNGGYGQIGGLDPKYIYEINYKATAGEEYDDANWITLPAGIYNYNVTAAGFYLVRVKDTEDFFQSAEVEKEVLSAGDFVSLANEVKTFYLPEDFEESKAEYEIDVTDMSWLASLTFSNISVLSPEATVVFTGENYKFIVSAKDFDPNKIIHYYNVKVSLGDEARHSSAHKKFKELAGDAYVTDYVVSGIDGLPFDNAELMIYLGEEYEGASLTTKRLHVKSGRLANSENTIVTDGWATFTKFDQPYVIISNN